MKLESVRELKSSLLSSVLPELNAPATIRAMGVRAQEAVLGEVRTLALGIAVKGKEFRLAVRSQRRLLADHPLLERVRKQARGEIDYRYIGKLAKRAPPWHQRRQRPLRIGASVGHFRVTAGTLGCFVTGRSDGAVYILSNNHVLADENRAAVGDAVLQPGDLDDGRRPGDVVGKLARFVRLRRVGANLIDAALSTVTDGLEYFDVEIRDLGNLAGVAGGPLDEGDRVAKVGRTTGRTDGRVTAIEVDNVIVEFDIGDLRFDNTVEIEGAGDEAFSDGGDSGSLIVNRQRRAVALLFAGGDQGGANGLGLTYGIPIRTVLDALKVDLPV